MFHERMYANQKNYYISPTFLFERPKAQSQNFANPILKVDLERNLRRNIKNRFYNCIKETTKNKQLQCTFKCSCRYFVQTVASSVITRTCLLYIDNVLTLLANFLN